MREERRRRSKRVNRGEDLGLKPIFSSGGERGRRRKREMGEVQDY